MLMNIAKGHGFSLVETPCQDIPEIFFSEEDFEIAKAKELCRGCPVKDRCLRQATEDKEQFGVWGGELFPRKGLALTPKQVAAKADFAVARECNKGLHILPAGRSNNTCVECANQRKRERYQTPQGKAEMKARNQKRKNKIGGTCYSGKHVLTEANTERRSHDNALMCIPCLQSKSRVKFRQDKGIRDGHGFSHSAGAE